MEIEKVRHKDQQLPGRNIAAEDVDAAGRDRRRGDMISEQGEGEGAYAAQGAEPRVAFRRGRAEGCRSARRAARLILIGAKVKQLVFDDGAADVAADAVEIIARALVRLRACGNLLF